MSPILIKRIVAGDSSAAVEFYRFYSKKILSYLLKKLPSSEDAQEIVNDVFLEAIDSIAFLKKKESVMSWLYAIARNKVADFYRKRKIKSIFLSKMPFLEIIESQVNQPEFQYEKNRIRDKIERTFHILSDKYQKILKLHYEEKISLKEIAPIFNLSFKATESLLFRARQKFKKEYERI